MNEGAVFPIGLTLANYPVAVTGDNAEAAEKAHRLLRAGAKITLYCPAPANPALAALVAEGKVTHITQWLTPEEVGQYSLVLSTRFDATDNATLSHACRAAKVLVSCFDKPELSDFSMPALVQRGRLQIAVFTGGASPALSRKIRLSLERLFDDRFAAFLDGLGQLRERLKREELDAVKRREALIRAVDGFEISGSIKYPEPKTRGDER